MSEKSIDDGGKKKCGWGSRGKLRYRGPYAQCCGGQNSDKNQVHLGGHIKASSLQLVIGKERLG